MYYWTGTMITIMRKPIKEVLDPIYTRLEDEQSLLRRSGDVSMLAQALMDVCEYTHSNRLLCGCDVMYADEVSCGSGDRGEWRD